MKNEPLWNKTVDILVKAYLGDTLRHSLCQACAVGNIIAANNEMQKCGKWPCGDYAWSAVTSGMISEDGGYERGLMHIKNTGYSVQNIVDIEYAFEHTTFSLSKDQFMFNGLMSVIDTLMQIHEANDTEADEAKGLFRKELVV